VLRLLGRAQRIYRGGATCGALKIVAYSTRSQRTTELFPRWPALSSTARLQRSANRPSAFQIPGFPQALTNLILRASAVVKRCQQWALSVNKSFTTTRAEKIHPWAARPNRGAQKRERAAKERPQPGDQGQSHWEELSMPRRSQRVAFSASYPPLLAFTTKGRFGKAYPTSPNSRMECRAGDHTPPPPYSADGL
jgi:hypothetical protein